jgi:hypothetical protein
VTAVTTPQPDPSKRAAARRTVWLLALVALAIYAAFILGGVFGVTGAAP